MTNRQLQSLGDDTTDDTSVNNSISDQSTSIDFNTVVAVTVNAGLAIGIGVMLYIIISKANR